MQDTAQIERPQSERPKSDRFESLDVLRGIAVLGIFAVNIWFFAFPLYVAENPTSASQFATPAGVFWWSVSKGVFSLKFITIFSALFGAGIVLFLGEEKPSDKISLYRRRMFWLLLIGMLHAYLLWYGDVLVSYAVIGFLIARSRIWRPRSLFIVAGALLILNFLIFSLQSIALTVMSPEEIIAMKTQMWLPTQEIYEGEIQKYRGGFWARLQLTAGNTAFFQFAQTFLFGFRIAAIMMVGMGLYKHGFFTLKWRPVIYLGLGIFGSLLGLAGSFWGVHHHLETEFAFTQVFPGQAILYWASLLQAFGYGCLIMFACTVRGLRWARMPFAAAGRMALSNYLASTLIGVLIFFGPPGLGKMGSVDISQIAILVGGVWLFILVWSPLWLSLFRFGPFEWVWRSLTYQRWQPLFKKRSQ